MDFAPILVMLALAGLMAVPWPKEVREWWKALGGLLVIGGVLLFVSDLLRLLF